MSVYTVNVACSVKHSLWQQVFIAIWQNQLHIRPHIWVKQTLGAAAIMTAFSAVIFCGLSQRVLQACIFIQTELKWVLGSDKITVFMCPEFKTEWLSDRVCKFPQVSPRSASLPVMRWFCCCWVAVATQTGAWVISHWLFTAGAHTVQPRVYQSLWST